MVLGGDPCLLHQGNPGLGIAGVELGVGLDLAQDLDHPVDGVRIQRHALHLTVAGNEQVAEQQVAATGDGPQAVGHVKGQLHRVEEGRG